MVNYLAEFNKHRTVNTDILCFLVLNSLSTYNEEYDYKDGRLQLQFKITTIKFLTRRRATMTIEADKAQ